MYRGSCIRCEKRPGRGRSGLCAPCHWTFTTRRRRRTRLLLRTIGEALPLEWVLQYPDAPKAKTFMAKMLTALYDGTLTLASYESFDVKRKKTG